MSKSLKTIFGNINAKEITNGGMKIKELIFWVITILVVVFIVGGYGFLVMYKYKDVSLQDFDTMMFCCGGQSCTDTYYSEKDNLCHLALCEQFIGTIVEFRNCTYNPYIEIG